MQSKRLKLIYGLLLFLLLVYLASCSILPPDVPVCVEFNPSRGRCVKIISGQDFIVDDTHLFEGKTWWDHRASMIQMPASSWAQIKAYTIKMCKKYKNCQQEVSSWDRTIQNVDDAQKEKGQVLP